MPDSPPLSRLDRVRTARPTAWLAWIAAAFFAGWAAVRVGGFERGYPASALLAFTPYIGLAGLLTVVVALALWQRLAALAIALSTVALAIVVLPRVIADGPPDPRPSGPEITVLGMNLMLGSADLDTLEEAITSGGVDVVAFSELTPRAARRIAASPIGKQLPYEVSDASEGSAGTGLRSRYPLRRLAAPGEIGNDLPTIRAAIALPGGERAEAFAIHPMPPLDSAATAQLDHYLEAIPSAAPEGVPRLLIGDFNSTLDDRRLRALLDRGYTDAADARGAGLEPTWPGGLLPPPVTIDHVLADDRAEVLDYATVEVPGTDHRAVRALLRLPEVTAAEGPRG